MGIKRWIILAVLAAWVVGTIGLGLWLRARDKPLRGADVVGAAFVAAERSDDDVAAGRERIFHRPDCPHAAKIGATRRIGFRTAAEAEAAGYRPCRVCRP